MITLNVFKKTRTTKEGKPFPAYITRIVNKATGEEVTASLKFEEDVDTPKDKDFPIRINVLEGSISSRKFTDKDGVEKVGYTVWVRDWKKSDEVFVDKSMDEWT